MNKKLSLTIGWLYPALMSTYGDRGNIIVLQKRCEWRGITATVKHLNEGFSIRDLRTCNLLFMGGAQDRQQKIVSKDLTKEKVEVLKEMIEGEIPGLYICGAYQFLGKYYKEADGTVIPGLNILNLFTEHPEEGKSRLIGNIVIKLKSKLITRCVKGKSPLGWKAIGTLVGFENHGGRTYSEKGVEPLGRVIEGYGNNGKDGSEGAVYKNSFGSYLHGPILPKNPHFADLLIKLALEKKYKKSVDLSPLEDSLEWQAHEAIVKRLGVKV